MRVALFFDGKNHMKDLRRAAKDRWLNHGQLAEWTVERVGGNEMLAAYYYTGVPTPHEDGGDRHALTDLLDDLERRPGFFVRRFNRRATSRECPHCNQQIHYTEEKMVDTSLVADMILLAVQDAFDIAVVFSGDLDIAPAIDALHALGKKAWIATFGSAGLSRALGRSAWGTINLLDNIDEFSYGELTAPTSRIPAPVATRDVDQEIHRELRRAEAHFKAGGGFVGAHYFIHRWKGHNIPDAPELRRQALQRLLALGRVEAYQADGKTALRTVDGAIDLGLGADGHTFEQGSFDENSLDSSNLDPEAHSGRSAGSTQPWSEPSDAVATVKEPETVVRRSIRKK
ncbi:MAG: uncharacterized LabA/DUF88 family protein [Kiritimatiellia bacterium]|jgi:uncharacterized LabA/DUF88 family protein